MKSVLCLLMSSIFSSLRFNFCFVMYFFISSLHIAFITMVFCYMLKCARERFPWFGVVLFVCLFVCFLLTTSIQRCTQMHKLNKFKFLKITAENFYRTFSIAIYSLYTQHPHTLQSPYCYLCPWVLSPFCSITLPTKLTHSYHPTVYLWVCLYFACYFILFIRFHIWVKSYGIFLSLTGLFHLV